MPKLEPYLIFDGDCADAMRFYHSVLGGSLNMMTHGQSPMAEHAPADFKDKIMHAQLLFDSGSLMASDNMPGAKLAGRDGCTLSLQFDSAAEARRIFDALAAGGKVEMAVTETFWSEAWGSCRDRFGVAWMVNGPMKPM